MARKLYKSGSMARVWDLVDVDYIDVDDDSISLFLADGWVENPLDVLNPPAPSKKGKATWVAPAVDTVPTADPQQVNANDQTGTGGTSA
jgi:hypothetical protein